MSGSLIFRGTVDGGTPTPAPPLKGEGGRAAHSCGCINAKIERGAKGLVFPSPLRGGVGVGVRSFPHHRNAPIDGATALLPGVSVRTSESGKKGVAP